MYVCFIIQYLLVCTILWYNKWNESAPVPVLTPINQNIDNTSKQKAIVKYKNQNENRANYYKPYFTNIEENNIKQKYSPAIDVHIKCFKPVETSLEIYINHQKEGITPTPLALINHYFSEEMIDNIAKSLNVHTFEWKWR